MVGHPIFGQLGLGSSVAAALVDALLVELAGFVPVEVLRAGHIALCVEVVLLLLVELGSAVLIREVSGGKLVGTLIFRPQVELLGAVVVVVSLVVLINLL